MPRATAREVGRLSDPSRSGTDAQLGRTVHTLCARGLRSIALDELVRDQLVQQLLELRLSWSLSASYSEHSASYAAWIVGPTRSSSQARVPTSSSPK